MLPKLMKTTATPEGADQAVKDNLFWTGLRRLFNFRAAALTNSFTRDCKFGWLRWPATSRISRNPFYPIPRSVVLTSVTPEARLVGIH